MKDDYEIDWDSNDMFDGDVDFDMEFDLDPNAKKSFIGGFASGFLTGITDNTIGTTDAKIKTLRTVLPSTWSNALDKADFLNQRYQALEKEFQENNAQTAKSLQNIAGRLSEKMSDKMPSFLTDGINKFSEKDFSDWEKIEPGTERLGGMDDADDDSIEYAQDRALNSESSMFSALGDSLNSMTAAATASLQSTMMSGNRQLINIEGGIRDMLAYQRNVQAKMDQAMLNLTARHYVQSTKFYKFMEAGIHAEVKELKRIVEATRMSDFEKTSTFAATKQAARDSVFNAIGRRVGGLGEYMNTKFGASARKELYGSVGALVSGAEMGIEMGGMEMSKGTIGDMLGQMVAGVAIENLPYYFTYGGGKKMIDKLMKNNPKQAKWIRGQVKQLTDMGNVVSYVSTSGKGMINRMADNYQAMDEMKFYDYEDYLSSLRPGEKPIPKSVWKVTNSASNVLKGKINNIMVDVGKARGTQYTIEKRNPKDMAKPGIWKEMNNITLNEVIPGLISQTNQILEQIRTGRDDVEKVSYNYTRGQFMTESDRRTTVKADMMQHSDFKNFASAALAMVDDIDTKKQLSTGARKALAMQIAKDVDAEKAFNPFYYVGNIPGMSEAHQKEVHAVMMRHFGLKTQDVNDFNDADSFTQLKMASKLPTRRGQERLAKSAQAADNLMSNYPNVAERINLLRQTGNEQMLRDLGVIYNDNGVEKINIQMFHDRIGQYMDDPNNPELRGATPNSQTRGTSAPTRGLGMGGTSGPAAPVIRVGGQEELNSTLQILNERLSTLGGEINNSDKAKGQLVNWDAATGDLSAIKDSNAGILANTAQISETMEKFYELAAAGKLLIGKLTVKEEREEEKAKLSIWEAVKSKFPEGALGKSMEFLSRNSPLIMGGLLGGIGGAVIQNPIAAAAVASAGLLAGGIIQYWGRVDNARKSMSGEEPSDEEDILDDKGEPLLRSAKLKAGDYIDAVTRRVIKTWREIKGPIYDIAEKTIIGIRDLGAKIFGADGRAVVLRGITAVKDAAVNTWNATDPIGRVKGMLAMGKSIVFQQDVYVKGDPEARLRAVKFKSGDYYVRNDNGEFKPISGWNEINGPVYDEDGNELISKTEYEEGLITSSGAAVRNVGSMAAGLVGAATGMGKAGFDTLMGKFGYNKPNPAQGPGTASSGVSASSTGVERRLDRIYKLLEKQFGISVEDDFLDSAMAAASGGPGSGGNSNSSTSPFRLNSLSFKAKQKEQEEKHKVNEAIIKIAKNTEDLGGGEEGEKKEGGILGKLKGFIGGLGTFGMNLIKNPIGAIGSLVFGSLTASASRLAKIGTMMFSGVLGMASPIYKLLKMGFGTLAKAFIGGRAAKAGMDALDGLGGDGIEQRGQSTKKKRKPGKNGKPTRARGRGGKLRFGNPMSMLVGTGLSYFGAQALGADEVDGSMTEASGVSMGERDEATGHYRTGGDVVTDAMTSWIPQGQLLKAGTDLFVDPETKAAGENMGLFWSSDGKFFFKRDEMEAHEDEVRGITKDGVQYGLVNDVNKPTLNRKIRLAMYGVKDPRSSLGRRVLLLEKLLYPYVAFKGDSASLKPDTPVEKLLTQFMQADPTKYDDKNAVQGWYLARFKPIFLTYNAAISAARMGDIDEFDRAKNYTVVQVIDRVSQALATLNPFPYNIDARIDSTTGLMNEELTRHQLGVLIEKLKKEFPAPEEPVERIASDAEKSKVEDVQGAASRLQPTHENAAQDKLGAAAALASQQSVNQRFVQPAKVTDIDVSDMLPGTDTPMDPFVMVRLAAYGNIDNMPWRVATVLRLERYLESFVMVMGDDVRFTGKSAQILELFKASFRIENDIASNNWMAWFRDRFLPVMMTYFRLVKKYKGSNPSVSWKSLSATNRAQIAHALADQLITVNDQQVSVWEVEASPFPNSKSGKWADRASKYLEILDAKAQQARLKDPELEDMSSRTMEEKDPQKFAQDQADIKAKAAKESPVSTSGPSGPASPGFSGSPSAAVNQGGYYPNATMSAPGGAPGSAGEFMGSANANFNPEFIKKAGEDKGVKMSLEQGEKLMLNHLVKAGFKDNKVLALALAMARKETGNYSNTVENTNWSAPTLLKYFKNIPDAATAQKVAAMSPAERAMWVYGRAPKGPQLGNAKPEDGWDYRGRGFFQLTGKANYERFKKDTGIDVVSNPKLVSEDPNVMAESAVWYLKNNAAMKSIAKTGDFETAVRGINGGNAVPATDERRKYYNDYLNKLRSGAIDLGDTSGAVEDPDAADPMAKQTPNAADQNVPPEQKASEQSMKPTSGPTVTELIAEGDASKKPSNVPTSSSASTSSSLDPSTPGTPASDAVQAGASKAVKPAAPSTPPASSVGTTSTEPKVAPVKEEKPAKAPEVKIPDNINTTDTTVAGMIGQTNKLLAQILKAQDKDDGSPLVSMK